MNLFKTINYLLPLQTASYY